MLASIKWLNDYVDIDLPPQELALALTMAGLEVESITDIKPSFSRVVVGRIDSIATHPQSDQLSICIVSTPDSSFKLVCGAGNIFAGALVPLAPAGARVGSITIEKTVIRGIESEGMLCSEAELAIGEDSSGIMILDRDLTPGTPLEEALYLADTILEIGVTPNRSDCLSLIGIAREVAALTGRKLKYPSRQITEDGADINLLTAVAIQDPDLCPRYSARLIQNVKIAPSPFWLKKRLAAAGLRPINNVVDVTNYVMMELGQPLHAFDHRQLAGGRILVRRAQEGEAFLTLDDKEHILQSDTLMICDAEKPVAIAGIMGGKNSEVEEHTTAILLESAYFSPVSIRRSAKALGMASDASFRFERGIDPEGVVIALDRAAQLIAELAEGRICRHRIDQYPGEIKNATPITLRGKRVNQLLGTELTGNAMTELLSKLEMMVVADEARPDSYLVAPPSCRVDITREIDIIEEIARIHGYDKIGTTLPTIDSLPATVNKLSRIVRILREKLSGGGYTEVINYSFVPEGFCENLLLPAGDPRRRLVRIGNPLTEDQSVMRTSLVYSLLENWRRNANQGCHDLRIFETGRAYFQTGDGQLPEETNLLAALMTGRRYGEGLDIPDFKADFYDLKGTLESLLADLNFERVTFTAVSGEPFLHPGRTCHVHLGDEKIGILGEINPLVLDKFDLKNRALVLEIDLDKLAELYEGKVTFRELSKFPPSVRDAAFIVDEKTPAEQILSVVYLAGEVLLEKVQVFDLYSGPGLPAATKSLGLRFHYRSQERTLTDEEVNEIHRGIIGQINEKTGARLRG